MKDLHTNKEFLYIALLFLLGLFNNLGYVLVWVSSGDLSNSLKAPNLVSLYLLVMQVVGLIMRFIHTKFLIKIGYKIKLFIVSIMLFLGYVSFYFILHNTDYDDSESLKKSFYYSLIPSLLLGSFANLGEVAIVGYMKKLPSTWMVGFTGGTGMAGVLGALIKLGFTLTNTKSSLMWLIMSISGIIYFIAFIILEAMYKFDFNKQHNLNDVNNLENPLVSNDKDSNNNEDNKNTDNNSVNNENNNDKIDVYDKYLEEEENNRERRKSIAESVDEIIHSTENINNRDFDSSSVKDSFSQAGYYIINLGLAYFCSYNIVHFTERYEAFKYINTSNVSIINLIISLFTNVFFQQQYIYFSLAYQVGVWINRSAISILKKLSVKSLLYMVLVQSLLFIFWYLLAQFGFVKNFPLLIILVFLVGLNEGAVYVFGFYLIYEDKEIENNIRELCLNLAFNVADICLISSSLFCLLVDNTILSVDA